MKLDPNWRLTVIGWMLVGIFALLALKVADILGFIK